MPSWVNRIGPRVEPTMAAPKFCITPMLKPRRFSSDSMATMDWPMAQIGPSARPSSIRAASSTRKPVAAPDRAENSENRVRVMSRMVLRLRVASASEARKKPEMAIITDRPEESSPSWVLERWNSGMISGDRTLTAIRSMATTPLARLIIRSRPFS